MTAGSLTTDDLNEEFYKTYYDGTSLQSIVGSIKTGDMGGCFNVSIDKTCTRLKGKLNGGMCDLTSYYKTRMCKWLGGQKFDNENCTFGYLTADFRGSNLLLPGSKGTQQSMQTISVTTIEPGKNSGKVTVPDVQFKSD